MQYPRKGSDRALGKEAIIDQPCSRQHKQKGAGPESLPAEHLPHLVKKADRKGEEQQAKDDKIGVLKPGVCPVYPERTHRLAQRGVAWSEPSCESKPQDKQKRANHPGQRAKLYQDVSFPCEEFLCGVSLGHAVPSRISARKSSASFPT